jgi:hypothetical protein
MKLLLLLIISLVACNRIENAGSLSKKDFKRFRELHIMDSNEHLIKFYSEYRKSVAGNFYTDKGVASYWLDERDESKNKIEYALYKDIQKIDTVYYAGLTYCPYMLITRKDRTRFKVGVDGSREEIREFFNDALQRWHDHKR